MSSVCNRKSVVKSACCVLLLWLTPAPLRAQGESHYQGFDPIAEKWQGKYKLASACQDWGKVEEVAHRIAGLAGSIGFPSLSDAAKKLEQCARGDKSGVEVEPALIAFVGIAKQAGSENM